MKRQSALVLLAFTGLAAVATWPLVLHLGRALPGDLGDPLFTSWTLAWDAERLRHGLAGLWDAPILFPSRHALAFSEHMIGIAVFVAPVILATGNAILGYDVAFLLTYVLAGAGMYLLVRELTGRGDAAFLAGIAFAFAPMRALHVSHLQVLACGWMPIALWGLHRFIATRAVRPLIVFAAAFTLEALSNSYFIYYLALASAFVVADALISRPGAPADRWRAVGALAITTAAVLVCLAPVVLAYLSVRRQYGFTRPYEDLTMFAADVRSYVSVPSSVRLWARWLNADTMPERQLFPGAAVLLGAVAALWPGRGRRRAAVVYAAMAVSAFVLSLGPEPAIWGHRLMSSGPYAWVAWIVPGMDGLRAPARLAIVTQLALCVLAGLGFARLLAARTHTARFAIATAVAVVMIADGWAAPIAMAPFDPRGRPSDRSAYRWLAQQPPGAVIELPIAEWSIAPTLTYQFATLTHGHAIVNGYSGYNSQLQMFLGGAASPLNDLDRMGDALDLLRDIGVRYVLVHPGDYQDAAIGAATIGAIAADPPAATEGFRSDAVVAFRLAAPETATAPATAAVAGSRVSPVEFRATASDAGDRLPLAFDGDMDTRWLTGRPQSGDEWIRLEFDRPRDLSRIELQTAPRSFGDYPRELRIESTAADGTTKVLASGPVLIPYGRALATGAAMPAMTIPLPPAQTRVLTIRQTGRTRRWFWAIHELNVYAR